MTKIFTIDAPAHVVWAALDGAAEVGASPDVAASFDGVAGSGFSGAAGVRAVLAALDEQLHRLAVVGRCPLVHHESAFQVAPDGPRRSRLVWSHRVAPRVVPGFADAIEASASALKAMFECR